MKIGIMLLRQNIVNKCDKRRNIAESDYHYQRQLVARFFSVFKNEDTQGKARERKLVSTLLSKRHKKLRALLGALI